MIRVIIFIIACLTTLNVVSQNKIPQTLGGKNTITTVRDQLNVDSAFGLPADTLKSAKIGSLAYKNGFYLKSSLGWIKVGEVLSVFGRTGTITAQSNDYTFAQIGSKPNTISGYGITDAVSTSGSYINPSWINSLAYSKLTGTPTIPSQFNPIAGTNISLVGTYPNVTISAPNVPTFNQLKDSIDKAFNVEDSLGLGNGILYDSINNILTFVPDSMKTGEIPVNRLPSTGVTPGTYSNATVTVNEKGQVTSIATGSSGAGNTNLSNSRTSTAVQINSSTGAPTTIPSASILEAGAMSAFDKRRSDTSTTFRNSRQGDTIAYAIGPAADTIVFKGIELIAGSNVTVTKNITQDKNSYTIASTGGSGGSADSTTFQTNYRADTMRTRINSALSAKQNLITLGLSTQYLKGDLTLGSNASNVSPGLMSDFDKRRLDSSTTFKNASLSGDSLLYSTGPDADTIIAKRIEVVAGSNMSVSSEHTQGKLRYVLSSTGGSSIDSLLMSSKYYVDTAKNNIRASISAKQDVIDNGTSYQIWGMNNTGTAKEWKTINGTSNIITVTNATNSVTLNVGSNVVTTTGSQILTNKTLTSPVINLTSDATGDIYYRNSGGSFTRLPIGSAGQVLKVASGIPSWGTDNSNSGTVTSVGLTMPTGFSVSGSPVTSSGTLAVSTTLNGILKGNGSGFTAVSQLGNSDISDLSYSKLTGVPTFTNGLTNSSGVISLGGSLTTSTTTIAAGTNQLFLTSTNNTFSISNSGGIGLNGGGMLFKLNDGGATVFTDGRSTGSRTGIQYAADYSADYTSRTLVDKAYVDNAITGISGPSLASGTYIPTATNVYNTVTLSGVSAKYTRVGDIVTVVGIIYVSADTNAEGFNFELTLPIASNFSTSTDAIGAAGPSHATGGGPRGFGTISANPTSDRVLISVYNETASSNGDIHFQFMYEIK